MNLTVPFGKTPSVLLLGNGINRAYNFMSWSELLNKISDIKNLELDNVPAPLQAVILTDDNVDGKLKSISAELVASKAPLEEELLLQKFVNLPFDAILTTNYTYELEKAVCNDFSITPGKASRFRKITSESSNNFVKNNLYTYFSLPQIEKPFWHIHGEAGKVGSLILGHYYYGKLVSKMDSYLPDLMRRYSIAQKSGKDFECRSWIDYFLIGNVTILGLGMDFSEFDLWWLVNAKKRRFPDTKITFYKPDMTYEQELLAQTYGVTVMRECSNSGFKVYYSTLIKKLSR